MRLLVLLLIVPTGAALTWDDPTGDVETLIGPEGCTWQDHPADWYPQFDVEEITFQEQGDEDLRLSVVIAAHQPGEEPATPNRARYGVEFEYLERPWRLYIEHETERGAFFQFVYVEGGYAAHAGMDVEPEYWGGLPITIEDRRVTVDVRKNFFHNDDFVPMGAGHVLRDVTPFARSTEGPACGALAPGDVLQDPIGAPTDLTIVTGNEDLGSVVLVSPDPTRSSNGAETTYVYDVEARNLGDLDDRLTLQLEIPSGWVVRAPQQVEVPAGETVLFPVAVTVPFEHRHGFGEDLWIRGASGAEPGKASELALRVFWSDPPQPGGHHPWIHLQDFDGRFGFLQTAPPADPGKLIPYDVTVHSAGAVSDKTYHWRYGLSPSRGIGLDFQPGEVTGISRFEVPVDVVGEVTARLVIAGDEPRLLAAQTQEVSWGPGVNAVEWTMPVESGVDRIQHDAGNLVLEFGLRYERVEPAGDQQGITDDPPIMPVEDSSFRLPLVDYHDIIDEDLASQVAHLSLDIETGERAANPGDTVVLAYNATNQGASPVTVDWSVDGPDAAWGRVAEPRLSLQPGESKHVALIVEVPADASDGDRATILLVGEDAQTGAQVFGRALVLVTTSEDVPDQAGLVDEDPGPAETTPLPLTLVFAALASVLRQRRGA